MQHDDGIKWHNSSFFFCKRKKNPPKFKRIQSILTYWEWTVYTIIVYNRHTIGMRLYIDKIVNSSYMLSQSILKTIYYATSIFITSLSRIRVLFVDWFVGSHSLSLSLLCAKEALICIQSCVIIIIFIMLF